MNQRPLSQTRVVGEVPPLEVTKGWLAFIASGRTLFHALTFQWICGNEVSKDELHREGEALTA